MGELIRETVRSIRAHAVRFGLTSLGIAWGALMLTVLTTNMNGMTRHFRHELEEIGPKLIFMGPGAILKDRVGERAARAVELKPEDVERIETLASVEHASPSIELYNQVVRGADRTKILNVLGLDSDADVIRNMQAAQGRFLSPGDISRSARVAFIGARAKERLFGAVPALGRDVVVGDQRLRVIGVATEKGDQLMNTGNPDDLMIVIPYTTAQRWFSRTESIREILVSPVHRERGGVAIRGARQLMGLHHRFDPASETAIWSVDFYETLQLMFAMLFALQFFYVVAGGITLFVGAIGVMNIMLVVVGERTVEIGLRKALGARSRDIFLQFAAEAASVAILAGVLGTLAGVGLVQLTIAGYTAGGIAMSRVPAPEVLLLLTGSLVAVAIVSGVVPAMRAARVPPAEALRAY
jgi:putative ABC transport system permease protein